MSRRIEVAARDALLQRRKVLLGLRYDCMAGEQGLREDHEPDPVDRAAAQRQADFLAALSDVERRELAEVHAALERLEQGIYGYCQGCGERIHELRLEAVPWARCCIRCAGRTAQGPSARAG
jgi:DnaK suppressor protein